MKLHHIGLTVLALALLVAAGIIITLPRTQLNKADTGKVVIAATIFPLADMVKQIGQEQVEVVQLIKGGASEHSFEITPAQIAQIEQASLIFAIGHGLDSRYTDAWKNESDTQVIIVDNNIVLKEFGAHQDEHEDGDLHEDAGTDPHYWLSIPNARHIAITIAANLSQEPGINKEAIASNLDTYLRLLDETDKELKQIAGQAAQKHFIAMHDAWQYLAAEYGFELVDTYEPREGQEPSVTDIQEMQQAIRTYGIQKFYAEPQKKSSAAIRFIERDLGLIIETIDPVGGIEAGDSYLNLMRRNIEALSAYAP